MLHSKVVQFHKCSPVLHGLKTPDLLILNIQTSDMWKHLECPCLQGNSSDVLQEKLPLCSARESKWFSSSPLGPQSDTKSFIKSWLTFTPLSQTRFVPLCNFSLETSVILGWNWPCKIHRPFTLFWYKEEQEGKSEDLFWDMYLQGTGFCVFGKLELQLQKFSSNVKW